PPRELGSVRWFPSPTQRRFAENEPLDRRPTLGGALLRAADPRTIEEGLDRLVQRRFVADLLDRATDGVDVRDRGVHPPFLQESETAVRPGGHGGSVPFAMAEDRVERGTE